MEMAMRVVGNKEGKGGKATTITSMAVAATATAVGTDKN